MSAAPGTDPRPPEGQAEPEARIFVGRRLEISQISTALLAGSSVIVKGRAGIGKRTLLGKVREELAGQRICLAPSVATPKQLAADLAEQIHEAIGLEVPERLIPPRFRAVAERTGNVEFRHIRRTLSREPVADQMALLLRALDHRDDVILFVESLEVPPTQAEYLAQLSERCQLCAALDADNRRVRIQRLLWKFQLTVDLKPLVSPDVRDWVEQWLDTHPVAFESPRIRKAFIRGVARDSNGIPAAVQGLLDFALVERSVTRATLREMSHDAALTYLDMTPVLVILSVGFMALRYISRGMGMKELMVMAGVGTSMFYLLLYFGRMMRLRGR
ncbi:P-loop NTPase family protein [Imhoffiella purpurea]|uniref:Uncharacterized protein n=1 Tax=Imhoffiella purpurea TaxID=1249627 RepID=W9VT60_9GAMM|nr:AAA family ATPase [Imhoffiella purpurea]EXJ13570.1 hypothetical protein D779_3573 [Imhoffiella purpurea]